MRSFRITPTKWYVGFLGVILCFFSALLYVIVSSNLARDVDRMLALQADSTAETIFAFWRAERAAAGFGPGNWVGAPRETLTQSIDQRDLPSLLGRWAQRTGKLDTDHLIRLVDRNGQALGASPAFAQLILPLTDKEVQAVRSGHTIYETFRLPDRRIRLITRPVMNGGRVLYYVQIATNMEQMDASLGRLRVWLLILVPATLLATWLLTAWLATSALGPVRDLIARTQLFMTDSLHEPVATISPASDDLERLTSTLSEMLVRLERTFRRLRQFSAAASHELRTPLTVMKGEISLALRKPRTPDTYQHVLQANLEAIDEMAGTVEKLLELSKHEATGEQWEPVELSALAEQQRDTFQKVAKTQAIRIDVRHNGPVNVQGDRRLLERLLANLLDNAIKHTPANGSITIVTERRGADAYMTVTDTGPGIPPEELPGAFNRFFTPRPATGSTPSTGLGLGLCRWIVEAHHGQIEAANAPGQGASFTIRLPLSAPSA